MSILPVFARLPLSGSFPIRCTLPDDHLKKLGRGVAVEQRSKTLAGFVVGGTVVHGQEGFLTLVLHDGGIIATFHGLQKAAPNKALVVCKLFVCPGKPLEKPSILSCLDWGKIDNDYKHVTRLLYFGIMRRFCLFPGCRAR
jgi:hypothetical protein